jgi:tripartite motif-containing protein 71
LLYFSLHANSITMSGLSLLLSGMSISIAASNAYSEVDYSFSREWGSVAGDSQFYIPRSIAVDSAGNVYVTDTFNYRIQKFSSDGTFISKWGSRGFGSGQFLRPEGVAVDPSGNVYVTDTENHHIQKFDSNGTFISKWGSEGSADGQFDSPTDAAVDPSGNSVYVADSGNDRIQVFSPAISGR